MASPFAQRDAAPSHNEKAVVSALRLVRATNALSAFVVPGKSAHKEVARAFLRFRELFQLYMQGSDGSPRSARIEMELSEALTALGTAPCSSALDLAMKTLAFQALIAACGMHASQVALPAGLISATWAAADLGAHIAGDALDLACAGGLVLQ